MSNKEFCLWMLAVCVAGAVFGAVLSVCMPVSTKQPNDSGYQVTVAVSGKTVYNGGKDSYVVLSDTGKKPMRSDVRSNPGVVDMLYDVPGTMSLHVVRHDDGDVTVELLK